MQSKKKGIDQESIQSSTTPDPGYKVTTSQLDITNKSQEISSFPAGDHKALINRPARMHNKNKTKIILMIHKRSTTLERSEKYFTRGLKLFHSTPTSPLVQMWIKTHRWFVCMKDPLLINASSPRTYESRSKKEINQR